MAKKAAPKAAAKPAAKKEKAAAPAGSKPLTKADLIGKIAAATEVTKKDLEKVFDSLHTIIKDELGKKGPGQFVLPGLLKLKVYKKPATKAKTGINPFTKQPMTIKAKPARNAIKVGLLKALKDTVS
ncbi:MAG: HU family DNA-binding protein [bacterium]